jgi:large subunit ribosomal protein L29
MKATKTSELRNLQSGEIATKLADAREELMKLRFQVVTGQLTDSSRLRILRRDIARMQTILREQASEQPNAETEGEA